MPLCYRPRIQNLYIALSSPSVNNFYRFESNVIGVDKVGSTLIGMKC